MLKKGGSLKLKKPWQLAMELHLRLNHKQRTTRQMSFFGHPVSVFVASPHLALRDTLLLQPRFPRLHYRSAPLSVPAHFVPAHVVGRVPQPTYGVTSTGRLTDLAYSQ
jgi:hypothetical protein